MCREMLEIEVKSDLCMRASESSMVMESEVCGYGLGIRELTLIVYSSRWFVISAYLMI